MTIPVKKPAAPRAAAAKTTTRTAAASPAAKSAPAKAAPKVPAKAATSTKAAAPADPVYEFTKPYKMLTGLDNSEFCSKVSAHLNAGYKLAGAPTMSVVAGKIYVGQAVIKESNIVKPRAKSKSKSKSKKK